MSQLSPANQLPLSRSGNTALSVCETAARRAGELAASRFSTEKEINFKGRANVVTDVDLACERVILDYVGEEFPDFGVLSEESAPVPGASPYTWVVDPIDGTRNFAEGIPHFCVVVAIADGDTVVAGATYDPVRDELFAAQRGHGATLNGEPISVSDRTDIGEAVLGFDLGYNFEQAGKLLEMASSIWPKAQGYRLMGSSALSIAYAACGRIDLYFHHSLSPWDIASGILLAQEAGGQVLDQRTLEPANLFSPGLILSNPGQPVLAINRRSGVAEVVILFSPAVRRVLVPLVSASVLYPPVRVFLSPKFHANINANPIPTP